jgi:hypothetical protein
MGRSTGSRNKGLKPRSEDVRHKDRQSLHEFLEKEPAQAIAAKPQSKDAKRQDRHRLYKFSEKEAADAINADPSIKKFHTQRHWPRGFERVTKRLKPRPE